MDTSADFAATTRIGSTSKDIVEPAATPRAVVAGPSFAPPAALEKYLIQAKGLRGAGAGKLIEQATSDKTVFVFAELADAPNVAELAKNEQFAAHFRLLELFAFGTWRNYKENAAQLPPLNEAQTSKLKQLTLITLAAKTRQLPYTVLLEQLEIGDVRRLEDLVIETIYAGLLKGRLDQRRQRLDVEWIFGRDVDPSKINLLIKDLGNWADRIAGVIGLVDKKIQFTRGEEQHKAQEREWYLSNVNKVLADLSKSSKSNRGAQQRNDDDDYGSNLRNSPKKGGANASSFYADGKGDEMEIDDDVAGGKRGAARGGGRKRQRP